MIRVILAIRARLYREGLAAALSVRPSLTVATAEGDAVDAIGAIKIYQPEVVLADIDMGCANRIVSLVREASPSTKLIAIGFRDDSSEELLEWAEAGAGGFVTCENSIDELVTCINLVVNGELACSPRLSAILLRRVSQLAAERALSITLQPCLTPRQARILDLLRSGQSNKQIARELGIEVATVKNHVHGLLQRLKVHRRHEAAAIISR